MGRQLGAIRAELTQILGDLPGAWVGERDQEG
jgi:hypothetical protein